MYELHKFIFILFGRRLFFIMWKMISNRRNKRVFQGRSTSFSSASAYVWAIVKETWNMDVGYIHMSIFITLIGVISRFPKAESIREVRWNVPLLEWIKCNIDGSIFRALGLGDCRVFFRHVEVSLKVAFPMVWGFIQPLKLRWWVFSWPLLRRLNFLGLVSWLKLTRHTLSIFLSMVQVKFLGKYIIGGFWFLKSPELWEL